MGLYVHSVARLPEGLDQDYFVYILDYGWDEPLGDVVRANFTNMADLAARNRAVVIAGTDRRAFSEEIFLCIFRVINSPGTELTVRRAVRSSQL
jgi:hypothetical protein